VGQLSSWFVLGALGFYPVNAATGVYVIGSPVVHRATIHNPESPTTFTIVAENNSTQNVYVQSVQLNGKPHSRSWFTHADIVAGRRVDFPHGRKTQQRMGGSPHRSSAIRIDRQKRFYPHALMIGLVRRISTSGS